MEEKEIELQDSVTLALVNSLIKRERNAFKITNNHYWKMFIDVVKEYKTFFDQNIKLTKTPQVVFGNDGRLEDSVFLSIYAALLDCIVRRGCEYCNALFNTPSCIIGTSNHCNHDGGWG